MTSRDISHGHRKPEARGSLPLPPCHFAGGGGEAADGQCRQMAGKKYPAGTPGRGGGRGASWNGSRGSSAAPRRIRFRMRTTHGRKGAGSPFLPRESGMSRGTASVGGLPRTFRRRALAHATRGTGGRGTSGLMASGAKHCCHILPYSVSIFRFVYVARGPRNENEAPGRARELR